MFPFILLISIVILGIAMSSEIFAPGLIQEGFANITPSYWASYTSPRLDIGPYKEATGYIRDPRYFNDYADVTRIGVEYDFCRVISTKEDPTNKFLACAISGTDNMDSTSFRTNSVKDGLELSHDDYMRNSDGRADYCRILKWRDSSWQALCLRSTDTGFDNTNVVDKNPPDEIATLLTFYQGCVLWLRLNNDMEDCVKNISVSIAGSIEIDETPSRQTTEGLRFNGSNQFLRLSDSVDLTLGFKVPLRAIRAVMVWVKFDEFTNNAKIFDFGNGKGKDNFYLGILNKGDPDITDNILRDDSGPSGAQPVLEMSPQRLMETTSANVNEWLCKDFEVSPRKFTHNTKIHTQSTKATLIYEVWDKQQRKMRMKVNKAIPLKKWVHICVATTNEDAFRPNMAIFINGEKVLQKNSGFLPSTGKMTNCYIGKSNWANSVSQYENRDELFKGSIFDFRMYQGSISETLLSDSYTWGKQKLGT